ncbi:nucleotidyltransferase family protein [Pleionea sp. CnH1-48]|uniref:nucleotidyltransferase family protein n=1 Tax=Pleionea sp. CnH1-48 TaxID=2954494 RepID=UPI002097854D|nr:nucleotidyltransferase family protein [Pleionea sp. CnH1-48]MCO7227304.1 nucleotidyltransferase family protein [Pleionea sp. CnH1-48]
MKLTNELQVAALLGRNNMSDRDIVECYKLLEIIDFDEFIFIIEQSKIWPSVYSNIHQYFRPSIPERVYEYLKKKYQNNVKKCSDQFRLLSIIEHKLENNGVSYGCFKGSYLALKLYGDLAKRYSNDIDIIVCEKDLERVDELLRELGFECDVFSSFSNEMLKMYFKSQKDLIYKNDKVVLELHIRLSVEKSRLSEHCSKWFIEENSPSNISVLEFIYLCWHSSRSLNFRLKWLVDIVEYIEVLEKSTSNVFDSIIKKSKELNVFGHISSCLYLSSMIFGHFIPDEIKRHVESKPALLKVINDSVEALIYRRDITSPRFMIKIAFCRIALSHGIYRKASMLVRLLFYPNVSDIIRMKEVSYRLPSILYIARPLLLLKRIVANK